MLIERVKERVPFKKSRYVRVYRCGSCGGESRVIESWHGSKPPGAFLCTCGAQVPL